MARFEGSVPLGGFSTMPVILFSRPSRPSRATTPYLWVSSGGQGSRR